MKKVIVGMSGGVDSSVTALLLKKQGYDVTGVTLNIWQKKDESNVCEKSCCGLEAVNDARKVCDKLDVPFYVFNFRDVFKEKVIDYFAAEYMKGRTPNPCNACNKYVKFEALLEKANSMGIEYIATGHYAKVDYNKDTGRYFLRKSVTLEKDQTYALYDLTQEQLKHLVMPLGDYTKPEVRKFAEEADLVNAKKTESQDICFIENGKHDEFIKENYNYVPKQGNFVWKDGKTLGKHQGLIRYTVGQRKGLGIGFGKPVYVTKLDTAKNQVVLGDLEDLFSKELIAINVNLMTIEKLTSPLKVEAKIRYSAKPAKATLYPIEDNNIRVVFDEEQKSITPGQAVVFYDDDIVVGGGIIK